MHEIVQSVCGIELSRMPGVVQRRPCFAVRTMPRQEWPHLWSDQLAIGRLADRDHRPDRVPTFETLCGTTTDEFYNRDNGTNYAQARYLCYYLQEQGLLVKYYHEFRRNAKQDANGIETLQRLLNEDDMAEFRKTRRKFVMSLSFHG